MNGYLKSALKYENILPELRGYFDVFTNQCLTCTDLLTTFTNHFLKLRLSGSNLAIHRISYRNNLKEKADIKFHSKIDEYFEWGSKILYPYRNIINHVGELSDWVEADSKTLETTHVKVPKEEEEWNFVQMRLDLKNYPSHMAWLVSTNNVRPSNINGDSGDSHRYERIVDFAYGWKEKIYELMKTNFEIIVEYQNTITKSEID